MVRISLKLHTHLQSFEDFVDRQRLDPATEFKEIQEYFLMTLSRFSQTMVQLNKILHLMMI